MNLGSRYMVKHKNFGGSYGVLVSVQNIRCPCVLLTTWLIPTDFTWKISSFKICKVNNLTPSSEILHESKPPILQIQEARKNFSTIL